MIELKQVHGAELLATARELFSEYVASLGIDLEYQGFSAELAGLPTPYAPPTGALFIAFAGADVAGCVGLRRLSAERCEMKRLYVRPAHQGAGVGKRLVEAVIHAARNAGYEELLLDTLASMTAARALYRKLGFVETAQYSYNYLPDTCFYALKLTTHSSTGEIS